MLVAQCPSIEGQADLAVKLLQLNLTDIFILEERFGTCLNYFLNPLNSLFSDIHDLFLHHVAMRYIK